MMGRLLLLAFLLASSIGSAAADGQKERAAIVSIELGKGVQEFIRAKAAVQVQQGLIAAGYDVLSADQTAQQLTPDLAACKSGPCLAQVGKALQASSLVQVAITRKLDSQIIVMRMIDPATGDALADIHEVCDLCGQDELEERIGVAASALRSKAVAELSKRSHAVPASMPAPRVADVPAGPLRVAIVPGIAVNLDTARVDALSQDLADALNGELDIVASGGLEVRRQLPPDGVPADCVNTPACTADVARRTGASQLLFVVMVDSGAGGSVQVDTTWVDPTNNRSASRPAIDLTSQTEAKAKFSSAARQLLPDAPVRVKAVVNTGGTMVAPTMSEGVPRHFSTAAKVTAGITVAGLGMGIAFGLSTRSKYGTCEDDLRACTDSKRDSIRTFGILADTGFVIATGAAIATVVLYVTSAREPHLIVTPSPEGAAVSAFGRF